MVFLKETTGSHLCIPGTGGNLLFREGGEIKSKLKN